MNEFEVKVAVAEIKLALSFQKYILLSLQLLGPQN